MTFGDIAQQAFVKNGMLAPGEAVPAELGQLALNDGNLLIQENNIQPLMIWTTDILSFPLTARTLPIYWYTIGPTGADFTATRPNVIKRANIILTSSNPASRFPLEIVDDMEWSDVTTPSLGSAPYPTKLYYDGGFPQPPDNQLPRIYLWPYPTSTGNELELFVPRQSSEWVSLSDTFTFPPGYANPYMLTLAENMCEGLRPAPASLSKSAARARAKFKGINSAAPKMSTTDGFSGSNRGDGPGQTYWNGWQR